MSRFLASISNLQEAEIVLSVGVDIVDLKDPMQGALGGLPINVIRDIVEYVGGKSRVSATIGDLPMEPNLINNAIAAVAATGVDIVKVGLFGGPMQQACIRNIEKLTSRDIKVVAVLFADLPINMDWLTEIKEAGFYGAMLDTAYKDGRNLTEHLSQIELKQFVSKARQLGLISGLAGALKAEHIPLLDHLNAEYLGFRSALCAGQNRQKNLAKDNVQLVKNMLHKNNITSKGAVLA